MPSRFGWTGLLMASTCDVRGCNGPRETIFATDEEKHGMYTEWAVCQHHRLALDVEPFRIDLDAHDILLGEDAPLSIVNFTVTNEVLNGATVELMLGRDGIETERIRFVMTPEEAVDMCFWVSGEKHSIGPSWARKDDVSPDETGE